MEGQGIFKDYTKRLRKSINTGYIVIPQDVDRNQFIENCLRTKRFSVLVEGGGTVIHNCYITKDAMRDIQFPELNQQLGSAVVFFSEPFAGKSVITGVVEKDDETEIDRQDVFMVKKSKDANYGILTVGGDGTITLDVIGSGDGGKINLNVRNDKFSGELNIHVKGSVNVYVEGGDTNLKVVDGDVNVETNQEANVKCEKLNVNKADEAMVRGDELQKQIDKTNDVVKAIDESLKGWTVVSQDGGAALQVYYNGKIAGKQVGDFSEIKSEKSFLE